MDAIVVGAGFAGLYMLHLLRKQGLRVRVLEAGAGIGGTWFWNRYPGARCDSDSFEYSYSFDAELEQEWRWSERYATQPEILRYLEHVADRFDLRRDVQLGTRVKSATYDETRDRWTVVTEAGERFEARFCVMATGNLSSWRLPDIPGRDTFAGRTYHTGTWPHEGVDFTGQRVAVLGTGSSGIQSIPLLAKQAKELVVYQRTPNFSIPAHNAPLDDEQTKTLKAGYPELRKRARKAAGGLGSFEVIGGRSAMRVSPEERQAAFEKGWAKGGAHFLGSFADLMFNPDSNAEAQRFVAAKIRQTVKDPAIAATLTPDDHPLGAKRICVDTEYYATFNRPNVTLVDLRKTPIEAIVPAGIRTASTPGGAGGTRVFDSIVFATGFDAMTGALSKIDIRGESALALKDKWASGPRTYLGLMMAGFPNLFVVTGPGSPSVLSNMTTSIEQHVDWIAGCITHMRARGYARVEATEKAETDWVQHVLDVASSTLYPRAASWYLGANVPGKPRVFMPYVGGVGRFRDICDEITADGYRGFAFRGAAA
jgi:cyclohexanone monooxygenase